jgi:UDP-glucose 4-epimerase
VKALITGGAGFIGRHLTRSLLQDGHDVVVLDDLSTSRAPEPDTEFVEGSVLDVDLLDRLVAPADTVFHLAAAVGVKHILDDPLGGLRTNLQGTENVLASALQHDARVVVASTSEIYGNNTSGALHEDSHRVMGSPLVSRWSYAQAKALDETLAHLFWRHHGLPMLIIRPFNIVGPGQTGRYGMVVPRFVNQALDGEPLTVFGTGEQTRCFCHVADFVTAVRSLVDHPDAYGQVFNVGRPEEISIGELARRVIAATGSSSEIRHVPYDEAYPEGFEDMERRVPDISRVRAAVGFEPVHTLDDILASVIEHEAERRAGVGHR